MYSFTAGQVLHADPDTVWEVWSDPDHFPDWDPREQRTTLHGPFAVGSTIDSKQKGNPGGISTITAVDPGARWTAQSPLPGGQLTIDHLLAPAGPGHVRATKRYQVTGPLTVLFRLYYGPRVRRALPASFTALENEASRRATPPPSPSAPSPATDQRRG